MSAPPLAALARRVTSGSETVPDAELLDRFVRAADQAAFELLVWRHGGMVWGVCRRILSPDHDAAEDACQAAFVALASHAARLRDRHAVAAWLHRVAVRASLDRIAVRRATLPLSDDRPELLDPAQQPVHEVVSREVRRLLDDGLNRLPEKLRLPFVLCELEGWSNAEAATALSCPVGTIESRLARARQRLRDWLTARGVAPAVVVATVALPESARAAMVMAGVPGMVSVAVRALAARAIPPAISANLRTLVAVGVVLVACAAGLVATAAGQPQPVALPANTPEPKAAAPKQGDAPPLPAGAVVRLGSPKLRHGGWVFDVCFSADGKRIASVGMDATVRVWDATTGDQLFAVRRESGDFGRVTFAPGGKVVVAVGHDSDLRADLWHIDAATGKVTSHKKLPGSPEIRKGDPAVRFSRDGSRLAIGTAFSHELVVFDALTSESVWSVKFEKETAGGVTFAPDGKTVAAATSEGKVRLFDAAGKETGVLEVDVKGLTNVALSPDGSMVVAAGEGVIAWDRSSGKVLWKQQTRAGYSLAFTPDGKRIVCSAHGFVASTLDPADGIGGGIGDKTGAYFNSMVEAACSALRSDGSVIAFGTVSGTICLFDPVTGKSIAPSADPPHEVRRMRFAPDGKTLYGWAADWFAWDVASGKQTRITSAGWNYGEPLSWDGKHTARNVWYSGDLDDGQRFEIRKATTGEVVHSHQGLPQQGIIWQNFTANGKAVVVGMSDGTLRTWATDTGKELLKLPGHRSSSQYHAFSADGRVLVTGAFDAEEKFPVRMYDLTAGKELAKFDPKLNVVGVAVSGDGRRVAAVTSANARGREDPREVAVVWDVASGQVLARVPQKRDTQHVTLSPDGRLLALAQEWEGTVRVMEVASGAERLSFRHNGPVTGLQFAPDGRTLAAASREAPVYLWDLTGEYTGKPPAWDADKAWDNLGSKDAAKAFAAIRMLRANPDRAMSLLKEWAKLPVAPEAEVLKKLLADLGSEDFTTREKATAALGAAGESVRAAMEAEAVRTQSPEAARRLEGLLAKLDVPTPAHWRLVRAVEVIEGIGSREAKELLEHWSGGVAGAYLTAEAKAALRRRPR